MNMSHLIKRIKMNLGISKFQLPVEDEELVDVIRTMTLPDFSVYFPQHVYYKVRREDQDWHLETDFQEPNQVYIFDMKKLGGLKIIDVADVIYNDEIFGTYGQMQMNVFGQIMSAAGLNLQQVRNVPITWEFQHPNKLIIPTIVFETYMNFQVVLLLEHDRQLASIPQEMENNFFKLALLDIQIYLYNTLQHFTNVDTTFGQIDLKIDNWSGAQNDRDNLLKEWDSAWIMSSYKNFYSV